MLLSSRICQQLRNKIRHPRRSRPFRRKSSSPSRLKAALAVLHRPEFPVPGWRLPKPIGSADQEKFMRNFSLMEMDYKQLRYEQALDRFYEIRQISTQFTDFRNARPCASVIPLGHQIRHAIQRPLIRRLRKLANNTARFFRKRVRPLLHSLDPVVPLDHRQNPRKSHLS